MKRMHLLFAAGLLLMAAAFTGCKTSRVWANKNKDSQEERREAREDRREERQDDRYDDYRSYRPSPPPSPSRPSLSVPLVITPSPGFIMKQTSDGRYYHKTAQGLLYWKGSDNRFCLDRMYLSRVGYTNREYEEWRRYNTGG